MAGSQVTKLVQEILANVKASGSREPASWRHPESDIRRLAQHDYAARMRKLLNRSDLDAVLRSARRIFPEFNCQHDPQGAESWQTLSPSRGLEALFSRVTGRLDIHFQGSSFGGPEGLALRAFFVRHDDESLKRPLIYVNTAHHPVAAAATLFHEVGHLVASEVFDQSQNPVHLFFDADYISHLEDVEELAKMRSTLLAEYGV